MPHKLDVLRRHCDAVGRDFDDIRLTAGYFADPFADVNNYLRVTINPDSSKVLSWTRVPFAS